MQIKLWTSFTKRENSTKQPTEASTITISDVRLKDRTSLYSPSFLLSKSKVGTITPTYLEWDNRYYYIDDVLIGNNDILELSCSMDVLATCKSAILNTSAFVVYSSSNYDSDIPDARLSTDKEPTYSISQSDEIGQGGYFTFTHVGDNDNVLMGLPSRDDVDNLIAKLFDNGFIDGFLYDPSDYTSRKLNNISDCIGSIVELPYVPIHSSQGGNIKLANYDTGINGHIVPDIDNTKSYTLDIPWQYDDFRNRSQYTSILLYLPGYGTTELNADDYIGIESITIQLSLNCCDGTVEYIVDGRFKYVASCGIRVPYGYSQTGLSAQSLLNGVSATSVGLLSGNVLGATITGFNAIMSNMNRNNGTVGGSGNGFGLNRRIKLITISHNTNVAPSSLATNYGRPLNAVRQLNGLNGYVQTANASVSVDYPSDIKERINSYLNGGVYIE